MLWTRDLVGDRVAHPVDGVGYIRSPIAYKRTSILAVGSGRGENDDDPPAPDEEGTEVTPAEPEITVAEGQSLMALDQATGRTIWKSLDFESGASSPLLINFDGQDQLVVYATDGVIGVDPASGDPLWRYKTPERNVVMSPVFNGEDLLLWSVGNAGDGSVALKLTKENGRTVAKEHWTSRKMRTEIGTPVRIGDCAFGSSGKLFMSMNLETGNRTWAKRGYQTASCVYGDGKVIILDEDGKLTLATATPEAFTVHSQCQITERYSYTPPTLVDTTLYLRDRKHIMALDVSAIQ